MGDLMTWVGTLPWQLLAGAGAAMGVGAAAVGVAASALDRPSLSRMVLKKPMVISRWR